jgi:acetylornithine/succinyldiaminopimelate/putrescine aminotransferase/nucleoside-diphosphate-sugar epimerase
VAFLNAEPLPTQGTDGLGVVADALARGGEALSLASRYLDTSLVDMLRILGFDRDYVSAQGSYLYDSAGRAYLDLHTGEGFASLGHNHPDVREALQGVLAADLTDGVQIHYSVLSGMLAEELSRRLPPGLDAVFFVSSGAEAVDSAMKFARAATRRPRLISCDSSFHGVTYGPLSLVGDDFFKEGFGPLLPGCSRVPFGDLSRLEQQLRKRDVAAFIVEPVQGRSVALPPPGYLQAAQELCRRYGTLFVADEIQTGLGRTGKWFALDHWGLEPDIVLVGKALSGGYMPVAAMVTTREIFQKAVGTLERSYLHQSTYGRNRLSMAAGLASMRVIERDGLPDNAAAVGRVLSDGIAELGQRYDLIKEVRSSGLMVGIELQAPNARWARLNWRLFHMAHEGLFPQLIVIPLHRDHGVITMAAGQNDVIKLLPPLTLSEPEARSFLVALDAVLADCQGAGGKNWRTVADIATATLRRNATRPEPSAGPAPRRSSGSGRSGREPRAVMAPVRGSQAGQEQENVCLVTGASGFIGGHIAQRLVDEGYQVRCLVRADSDTSLLDELKVELAIGDLTAPDSLARAAAGCRYVIHCAALVSDWGTGKEITRINVGGTRDLLAAAADASVARFVQVSSTDVYGHPGTAGVTEEQPPAGFRNWYAHTKLGAEAEVRRAARQLGLETVILRPATVYGPRSREVVGEIAAAIRGGHMVLIGHGRAVAGLCYVDNLVDAVLLALGHDSAPGQTFNITDGLPVTWKQFTDDLAAGLHCPPVRWSMPYPVAHALGFSVEQGYRRLRQATRLTTRPLISRQAVQVLGKSQDFSNRKAREVLGWTPRVDYQAGLDATIDWLQSESASPGRRAARGSEPG